MRKHPGLWFLFLALLVALPAHAGMFGPPGTAGREGQWDARAGYFSEKSRLKIGSGTVKATQTQKYGEIAFPGYSFSDDGESFLRLGMSDFDDGQGFESGDKLFATVGMRDIWYPTAGKTKAKWGIGTVVALSYFSEAKDSQGTVQASVKSIVRATLAVPVRWDVRDGIRLYGGPCLAFLTADVTTTSPTGETSETAKLKDAAGIVAGARIDLPRRFALELEAQAGGETSFGAAVSYLF